MFMREVRLKKIILVFCFFSLWIAVGCTNQRSSIPPNEIPRDLESTFFVGETFTTGNLYLYPFSEPFTGKYPQKIDAYFTYASKPLSPELLRCKAQFIKKYENVFFETVEKKSGYFAYSDYLSSFYQYRAQTDLVPDALVIANSRYQIYAFKRLVPTEPRIASPAEQEESAEYVRDWMQAYQKAYGLAFSDQSISVGGSPQTILSAEKLATFKLKGFQYDFVVSKFNTHSVADHGYIYFIVDALEKGKMIKTFKMGFQFGAL
jgi:hypothetical protein